GGDGGGGWGWWEGGEGGGKVVSGGAIRPDGAGMEEVHRELLRRAQEAVAGATRAHRRAAGLRAFVSALRATSPGELVRCAWCDRVAAGEFWIGPYPLLGAHPRERLRKSAAQGVCRDCFDRVTTESERQRTQRLPLVKKQ